MAEQTRLEQDLDFVRHAVQRAEAVRSPAPIYFVWAAIMLVGFALIDAAPRQVSLYWSIAAPMGWIVSCLVGWSAGRHLRQLNRGAGMRQAAHWAGLLAAVVLVMILPVHVMPRATLAPVILLFVALTYFLAGIHLDSAMTWIALVMVLAYMLTLFLPAHAWTLVGVANATALTVTGLSRVRINARAS